MKKTTISLVLLMVFGGIAVAQSVQITPIAGYTLRDKFSFHRGSGRIGDGFTYGGILSVTLGPTRTIDLTYTRQDSEIDAFSDYYDIDILEEMNVNYIFLGGTQNLPVNEQLNLFAGTNLGIGVYSAKNDAFDTEVEFAVGFNAGMKYFFSEKAGIRIQGSLNFPITNANASFWFGSGGASVGFSSNVPFLQFGFLGGLIFKLN